MPGAGALLEWPPPGLTDLLGAMWQLTRLYGVGNLLFLIAMLGVLLPGPRLPWALRRLILIHTPVDATETSRDLEAAVRNGQFRPYLYYLIRISVATQKLPTPIDPAAT